MKNKIQIGIAALLSIVLISTTQSAKAYTNSSNFALSGVLTKLCSAATTSAFIQWTDPYSINAPDVVLHNIGSNIVYIAVGVGGSSVVATVPSGTAGGFALNPGDFVIANKQQSDTVACITSSGISNIAVTPTYGN